MKEIDVIWLVEHTARELDVACAVRYYLQSRHKLSVKIVPMWHTSLFYLAQRYSPKIVAIPYAYGTRWGNMSRYLHSWREAIFVNLAWEQMYENAYIDLKRPEDPFVKKHVIHHAWGNFFKDYLIKSGIPEDHIFVNGHPAFMLYNPPYNQVYKIREFLSEKYALDPSCRWIFFPEAYYWVFMNSEYFIRKQLEWGVSATDIKAMQNFCVDSLKIVLGWLRSLAEAAQVEVILRPRPTTPEENYLNLVQRELGKLPSNIHLIKQYSIREWILASNLVISSHSTSLLEAAVAGRPTYMVEPIPIPSPMYSGWMKHGRRVRTEQEFLNACLQKSGASEPDPLAEWARNEILGQSDPIEQLAEYLYRLCQVGEKSPPKIKVEELEQIIPQGYSNLRAFQALPAKDRVYRRAWNNWDRTRKNFRNKFQGPAGALDDHFSQIEVIKRTATLRKAIRSARTT